MKKNMLYCLYTTFFLSACSVYMQDLSIKTCTDYSDINAGYSKADDLQKAVEELVSEGVPGCALALYSSEGWWTTSAGFAKIEDQTSMQTCHLQYLQSISKTYMAVAVLKLYEQGKIDLDQPMTKYLPEKYSAYIARAHEISVRMLLNHTSGVPEYNFSPAYVAYLLQHPGHHFSPEDYLNYIDGKPLDFEPGSRYAYRNSNYVILALLTDALTGDHAKFITETIFIPLGLTQTFYRHEADYLSYSTLINAYWDRYSNGIIENVSQMQRNNVATLIGDDGIVTTPIEAVKFLKALIEGKLLSQEILKEMQTWTLDKEGRPAYGLGLDYTIINGQAAYGHSGGGIGAGSELYYFPEKDVYFFIGINLGTVTESPLHDGAGIARTKIYETLLK